MVNKFDNLADKWDINPARREMMQKVFNEIKKHIAFDERMSVLDYGTGTGLLLLNIQPYVKHITGMDRSKGMLDVLNKKIKEAGITNTDVQLHDIEADSFEPELFDSIVSNMTLHHINQIAMFFNKMYYALKPGGTLCITDLDTENGSFHTNNDISVKHFGFDKNEINKLMEKSGFHEINVYSFNTIVRQKEGGDAEYTQFIATGNKN